MKEALLTIFLCGDIMTGRGIDQVLPHSCDPVIYEPYIRDARGYVGLAKQANGPIPRRVGYTYVWGDALEALKRMSPDAKIINLETSVTTSDDYWPGKGINYRMHPGNVPCITAAGIDCCSLANNHVLDWGYSGLIETIGALHKADVKTTGAGRDSKQAQAPAIVDVEGKGRVIVFGFASTTSGTPGRWAARKDRPGVALLEDLSTRTVRRVADLVRRVKQPADVVVASIHWGSNWGYEIPDKHTDFAHQLIREAGVDIIHGHSSHHVRPMEVYEGKLILYGCGDFLNDYEGIRGYESFRDDLTLMYFPTVDASTGKLVRLQMIPMQVRRFRLNRASEADTQWLRNTLNRECRRFGTRVELSEEGILSLQWN